MKIMNCFLRHPYVSENPDPCVSPKVLLTERTSIYIPRHRANFKGHKACDRATETTYRKIPLSKLYVDITMSIYLLKIRN